MLRRQRPLARRLRYPHRRWRKRPPRRRLNRLRRRCLQSRPRPLRRRSLPARRPLRRRHLRHPHQPRPHQPSPHQPRPRRLQRRPRWTSRRRNCRARIWPWRRPHRRLWSPRVRCSPPRRSDLRLIQRCLNHPRPSRRSLRPARQRFRRAPGRRRRPGRRSAPSRLSRPRARAARPRLRPRPVLAAPPAPSCPPALTRAIRTPPPAIPKLRGCAASKGPSGSNFLSAPMAAWPMSVWQDPQDHPCWMRRRGARWPTGAFALPCVMARPWLEPSALRCISGCSSVRSWRVSFAA